MTAARDRRVSPAPPGAERASIWRRAATFPFILAIRAYQVTLSPIMSGHCRFLPTCSNYAIDAYTLHGPLRGTWLTARRLLRCNPFGGNGYDPVPLPRRPDSSAPPTPPEHHQPDNRGRA